MNQPGMRKMVGLGGSLRAQSYSSAALRAGMDMARELGFSTITLDLRSLALPMYVPEQRVEAYPEAAQASLHLFAAAVRSADAMLWVTPAYHGAMSGVFKNALDFVQMLADDERPYLQGCAVGMVTVSDASPLAGMASCVQELRAWLAPTRVTLSNTDFTPEMMLSSQSGKRRLMRVMKELLEFSHSRSES
jgi:FMN reductase